MTFELANYLLSFDYVGTYRFLLYILYSLYITMDLGRDVLVLCSFLLVIGQLKISRYCKFCKESNLISHRLSRVLAESVSTTYYVLRCRIKKTKKTIFFYVGSYEFVSYRMLRVSRYLII